MKYPNCFFNAINVLLGLVLILLISCWIVASSGAPEWQILLEQLQKWKLAKYGHCKRRSEGLVMNVTEGEMTGKCLPSRRRTA